MRVVLVVSNSSHVTSGVPKFHYQRGSDVIRRPIYVILSPLLVNDLAKVLLAETAKVPAKDFGVVVTVACYWDAERIKRGLHGVVA